MCVGVCREREQEERCDCGTRLRATSKKKQYMYLDDNYEQVGYQRTNNQPKNYKMARTAS